MTNFGWWAAQAPAGTFMCQLCFESKPNEQAWMDVDGQRWDVCQPCAVLDGYAPSKETS